MKTITKMKGLILLLMAVVLHSSAYAEVITSTFKDQNLTTKEGVKWTGTASNFESTDLKRGAQFYKGNHNISYTNDKAIQSIEITYASSGKGSGKVQAFVGNQKIGNDLSFGKNVAAGTTYNVLA